MKAPASPRIEHAHRLVLVVGPSGAGKDSVLRAWRTRFETGAPHFARRVITRSPDRSEAHEPVSAEEFADLRRRGLLATWWTAHGLGYGVRWRELEPLAQGRWVVMNGSRAHLPALRNQAPGLRVIEVKAPAALLARRLEQRAREQPLERETRLTRAVELSIDADLTLINDGELQSCVDRLEQWWRRVAMLERSDPARPLAPAPGRHHIVTSHGETT